MNYQVGALTNSANQILWENAKHTQKNADSQSNFPFAISLANCFNTQLGAAAVSGRNLVEDAEIDSENEDRQSREALDKEDPAEWFLKRIERILSRTAA